ncbi:ketoacyl-ACP synthase III family protein [Actinomadura fibrosa]|uniref:Ketoacyl-ACP synthase III family protein n=1 Tax=Actinomadura fibrosa TaxID=111802 RepID=A0ABW2XUD9_9ACTN|nr:ketoacyl-ACP synthase III family protein [Actinomadura fibrosa]
MILRDFYIGGTGVRIPPSVPVSEAVAAGLYPAQDHAETQLKSIAVADEGFPAEMAVEAARDAILASSHDAGDIALTLYSYINNQGLPGWHSGAYVHRFAVGGATPVVEVNQRSNGGLASLEIAAAHLEARGGPAALLATGDRFGDLVGGRWNYDGGLVPGDGATALVLSRERGFARLLSLVTAFDSSLEEVHRGDAVYVGQSDVEAAPPFRQRKREYLARYGVQDTTGRFAAGAGAAITGALDEAGLDTKEIDHWVLPFIGMQELRQYYLGPLDIPVESTLWDWGRTVGHLGAGDQIAGLHWLRTRRRAVPGQTVMLMGVGVGFSWSCAVLRIEDADRP